MDPTGCRVRAVASVGRSGVARIPDGSNLNFSRL